MTNTIVGVKTERTQRYSGIIQSSLGGNTYQYQFVKDAEFTLDDTNVDADRIDTGVPIFTRVGDELGTFSFKWSNTVDLYDVTDPTTNTQLPHHWMESIANLPFDEIVFVETQEAPTSVGNKFVRITATLRIKKVSEVRIENKALEDIIVEGTIIALSSIVRSAS